MWIGGAPGGEVEQERRKIRIQHFRGPPRRECSLFPFSPEPITDAGLRPSCAAPPLLRRILCHGDRVESRQAGSRIEAGNAQLACIDNHTHPVDRQAGLRDGSGQHDLSLSIGRRLDRRVLRGLGQVSVQRRDRYVGRESGIKEPAFDTPDFRHPWKKDQETTCVLGQRSPDGLRHGCTEVSCHRMVEITCLNREHSAF